MDIPYKSLPASFSTILASYENGVEQQWFVSFQAMDGDCYLPRLSVSYLEIDYDGASEYFDIFDNSDNLIASQCGTTQKECNVTNDCLKNFDLSDVTQIVSNDIYTVRIYAPAFVHALCNGYSLYATLTMECFPAGAQP
jgi:hypothetical protein